MRSNAAKNRDDIINSDPRAIKRKHPWLSFKTVQNMSDAELQQAGFIMPPFHFHCRTTTVAVETEIPGERAARNEDGTSTSYVPNDPSYGEWKNKFVNGGSKINVMSFTNGE